MSITKEFREFFLRNVKVPTGTKKDQEINFATQYTAILNGISKTVYNRFLKDNYPSEDVFKKLFESVTFKLNTEDTATASQQGLVEIATDNEVVLGTNTYGGYQLSPKPSQVFYIKTANALPIIAGNFKVGDIYLIVLVTSADFGKLYVCTNASTPTFSLLGVTHPIPSGGTAGQVLEKIDSTNFNVQWIAPFLPNGTKVVMGTLTQTGLSAPVFTAIVDTISVATAYVDVGTYSLGKTAAFPAAKTFVLCGGSLDIANSTSIMTMARIDNNKVYVYTSNAGSLTNVLLLNTPFLIIVIP